MKPIFWHIFRFKFFRLLVLWKLIQILLIRNNIFTVACRFRINKHLIRHPIHIHINPIIRWMVRYMKLNLSIFRLFNRLNLPCGHIIMFPIPITIKEIILQHLRVLRFNIYQVPQFFFRDKFTYIILSFYRRWCLNRWHVLWGCKRTNLRFLRRFRFS